MLFPILCYLCTIRTNGVKYGCHYLIERYKMAISTIQSLQQPITFIIRLLV
ncbi:hypothetical protein V4D07_03755 [Paenibacillus taichungensis]